MVQIPATLFSDRISTTVSNTTATSYVPLISVPVVERPEKSHRMIAIGTSSNGGHPGQGVRGGDSRDTREGEGFFFP